MLTQIVGQLNIEFASPLLFNNCMEEKVKEKFLSPSMQAPKKFHTKRHFYNFIHQL